MSFAKRAVTSLLAVGFLSVGLAFPALAQQGFLCGTTSSSSTAQMMGSGGPVIPTSGTFRAMIVFVRFADDTADPTCTEGHQGWPHDQAQPDYAGDFLAPTTNPATFSSYRLTDYFYQQSQENFTLYGDTYGVEVGQHSLYDSGGDVMDRGQLSTDVIDSLDASGVNFADYDANNDDYVDHIFIVVRRLMGLTITSQGASGISELGPGHSCLSDKDNVSFDCEWSGSINNLQPILPDVDLTILLAHEFGHDLWRDYFVHIDPIDDKYLVGISFNYNLNGAKLIVKAFPTAARANAVA